MGHTAGIKIADWARAEQRNKSRAENKGRVRNLFGFLFGVTVLVFIFSDHAALQNDIYAKVGPLLVSYENSSAIKQGAIKHENEVDSVVTK
jgi:hypothetical protein